MSLNFNINLDLGYGWTGLGWAFLVICSAGQAICINVSQSHFDNENLLFMSIEITYSGIERADIRLQIPVSSQQLSGPTVGLHTSIQPSEYN